MWALFTGEREMSEIFHLNFEKNLLASSSSMEPLEVSFHFRTPFLTPFLSFCARKESAPQVIALHPVSSCHFEPKSEFGSVLSADTSHMGEARMAP